MTERPIADPSFRRLQRAAPLHRAVQDEIRDHIISNKLKPGDPLPSETELARRLGVSRNSVREAVKALESTGVLETRRGKGVYVRAFSFRPLLDHLPYGLMLGEHALHELLAMRKALESAMIGDAMEALGPDTVNALRAVITEMSERASRGEDCEEQDRAFHQLLFVDLGNAMLLQLFDLFWQAYHRSAPPGRDLMSVVRRHEAILDAVVSGDAEGARAAIRSHYVGIEGRLGD